MIGVNPPFILLHDLLPTVNADEEGSFVFTTGSMAQPQQESAAIVRFDSDTKEDATFEESNVEKQTKPSKKLKKKHDTLQTQPLPEVSAERYYQTTDLLDIGKGSEVSLRSLFGFSSQNEEPTEIDRPTTNKHVFFKEPEKPIKQEVKEVSEQSGYWKNAGMWHEPVFFPSGDIRFKEALDFINGLGKDSQSNEHENWSDKRGRLQHFYRNKMRRHQTWEAENNSKTQKKRPAMDASDGSSFHFYAQEDLVERHRKQKPHRPFFK